MAEERKPKVNQGPGPRGPRGPRPKIENPGKLFRRLMAYVLKKYTPHCIIVVICIVVNVLASTQGTMFMKTLI
ncbi:MAG: ABC transporter ATP-binding protein, partial [Lachnospiraceae bacterium]|nr:ABC transporter ATP-binding protein [Lachnospiraceae bacterium]